MVHYVLIFTKNILNRPTRGPQGSFENAPSNLRGFPGDFSTCNTALNLLLCFFPAANSKGAGYLPLARIPASGNSSKIFGIRSPLALIGSVPNPRVRGFCLESFKQLME